MRRKSLVTGCIMLMFVGMTGCGNTSEVSTTESEIVTEEAKDVTEAASEEPATQEETTEETSQDGQEETTQAENADLSALSDDLYSYQVMINGEVYQIPMDVSDFEAKGWKYDGEEEELDAYTYTGVVTYMNGNYDVEIDIVNLTDSPQPYSACKIVGIGVSESYNSGNDMVFILPKGIQSGISTLEDVKTAYGEPTNEYGDDGVKIVEYVVEEGYKLARFTFYDGKFESIKLANNDY